MKGMELNDNLVGYIKSEVKRIHHGRVVIEINASSKKIDVVTERRERFKDGKSEELDEKLTS